ncbi:MAG TPA: hypothetical protein VMT46_13430 [Anaerolineaceae bacterium]|nr:hypothetical protein [Anaerolineaceae bacterium]
MNHQPFEEWLLSDEDLTLEEERALQTHLEVCQECPQLNERWREVRAEIRRMPEVGPAPGFARRWQARLEAERIQKQRRQTWFLLLICGLGAIGLAIGGVYQRFGHFPSPIELVYGLMFSLTSGFELAGRISNFFTALIQAVPPIISLVLWIVISSTLLIWTLIWIISIWRLPIIKRSEQA